MPSAEHRRLADAANGVPWKRWGPYLADRQWGTVREDTSSTGDAWSSFSHDQARWRAYRWGEDGLAGMSDDRLTLCLSVALWNGVDPILKERLFGLTNTEGNHGEDAKEYWFNVDATPTHSYLRWLYKYPLAAFPYVDLLERNRAASRTDYEYELIDTGVFADDRYVDVEVEYAKASAEDLLVAITVHNRSADEATLHVLPTLWFRNTWARGADDGAAPRRPVLTATTGGVIAARHDVLGHRWLSCDGAPELLFCDNETDPARVPGAPRTTEYPKDGIARHVVEGAATVNPARTGTKAAVHHVLTIPAHDSVTVRLRLTDTDPTAPGAAEPFGPGFDATLALRRAEADEFYDAITPPSVGPDVRAVFRQALAGMIWSKQFYDFDVGRWLDERGAHPGRGGHEPSRNREWFHMVNEQIISMPDTWEYPWFAAWDLAFHTIALDLVDPDFARGQLELMLDERYLHPNGQIPAYEWNFGDVNPPVHAWATVFTYTADRDRRGEGDIEFLKRAFHKLLLNFTWWLNRKDANGNNLFQGGFLGLDNIGVFDRSAALPTGGHLEQADGTAWMALYAQNMLELSLELAEHDPSYESFALKFLEHFLWIASSMDRLGDDTDDLWDDEDGFYYDVLRLPDGSARRLKVRSMVGLLPLCATTVVSRRTLDRFPHLIERAKDFLARNPQVTATIAPPDRPGEAGRVLLSPVTEDKLRRILTRMLDEERFLSPYGIRSLSRWHLEHPYEFEVNGEVHRVQYEPAESSTGMFGGNSNWRGPVWFPVNALLIRALLQQYLYYGDSFRIECPTGSGVEMTLFEVARDISDRLISIFLPDAQGRRPVYGGTETFQTDPHWRDLILFYEYFHGDNGAGLGASHQTGWTGIVARLISLFAHLDATAVLEGDGRPIASVYRGDGPDEVV